MKVFLLSGALLLPLLLSAIISNNTATAAGDSFIEQSILKEVEKQNAILQEQNKILKEVLKHMEASHRLL